MTLPQCQQSRELAWAEWLSHRGSVGWDRPGPPSSQRTAPQKTMSMIITTNMIMITIMIIVIMIILIKPDQGWHWWDKLGCKGANSQVASDTELWIQVWNKNWRLTSTVSSIKGGATGETNDKIHKHWKYFTSTQHQIDTSMQYLMCDCWIDELKNVHCTWIGDCCPKIWNQE